LVPLAIGAVWALATPSPDLIVTGDGRHLALRTADGGVALLRGRAGDYIRDLLTEASGSEADLRKIDELDNARCNRDTCVAEVGKGGRVWRLLATRSRRFVDIRTLNRACAAADIVVSERTLPRTCRPRWLKADRALLRRTGGLAITLGEAPEVATVAERVGRHPWAQTVPASIATPGTFR
jgi:competence protein ComEC